MRCEEMQKKAGTFNKEVAHACVTYDAAMTECGGADSGAGAAVGRASGW